MDRFRYEFCPENKTYLLDFLKVANEQKASKFCEIGEYTILSNFFSLDEELEKELKAYIEKQNSIIDLTDDENNANEILAATDLRIEENFGKSDVINQSTTDDLTYSIKEHLEIEKCLSSTILNSLCESRVNQADVFSLLSDQLNFEEVINFGTSLEANNIIDDNIILHYIKFLLIKKLALEYSDQLQTVLNRFSIKYPNILLEELVKVLLSLDNQCKVFLQFVGSLNTDFKTKLFRKYIFSCENFEENCIGIVDILITTQVEYNTLSKLIEIISNSASNFTSDKSFGKLLVKVIELLGKNVSSLEQPLKHIIGCHKSIWKSKIQKAFDDCLQDSLSFSQSFRC